MTALHCPLSTCPSLMAALLLAVASAASAQEPPAHAPLDPASAATATTTLERVEVVGVRSTYMPYRQWVDAAAPIHALSKGLLRFGVRLYSQDASRPLRVSVQDDDQMVSVSPVVGQLFVVPHDLPFQGQQADVGVNRAEGQWGAGSFALVPQVDVSQVDMAFIRKVLAAYREVHSQRFPLKWRLLTRSDATFDVCSPLPGRRVKVMQADGSELASLPMDRQVKDHGRTTGRTLHCASIKASMDWSDPVRLALPEQSVALLGFRLI